MTDYDFGDLILISFPFTDQTTTKKRPAVVVSSAAYNRERPDIVLMAVTSQVGKSAAFGEVPVTEWKAAGLLKPSVIKPVGRLEREDRSVLQKMLKNLIGK